MLKNFFSTVAVIGALTLPQLAEASSRVWWRADTIGDHQVITVTVVQHPAGNVDLKAEFSNGRKVDGDNFVADIYLYSNDKLLNKTQLAGAVDATFFGGTRVVFDYAELDLEPNSITHVLVSPYQWDRLREPVPSFKCNGPMSNNPKKDNGSTCNFGLGLKERTPTIPPVPVNVPRQADMDPCVGYPKKMGSLESILEMSCDPATGKEFVSKMWDRPLPEGYMRP